MSLKCEYPGCKGEYYGSHQLKLTNEEGSYVEFPLCNYHFFVVAGGGFTATINKEAEPSSFSIQGPLKEVELIEQVMGAREMAAQIKNSKKEKSKI